MIQAQACMVPTAARELLALEKMPAGLRRASLAGEALSAGLVRGPCAAGIAGAGEGAWAT